MTTREGFYLVDSHKKSGEEAGSEQGAHVDDGDGFGGGHTERDGRRPKPGGLRVLH